MKWTNINISSLKYFVDAIDLGSLTLAAETNHISRPAISQAIRRIEDSLGYELIDHGKNKLVLTEKGRLFRAKAKKAINDFVFTLAQTATESIDLNIACSASIAEFLILPRLKEMQLSKQYNISIRIGATAKIRQLVAGGEVRVGILVDDGKTFGFDSVTLRHGNFTLRSKGGGLLSPIITTEKRPEVIQLMKALKRSNRDFTQHIQVESWTLCQRMADQLEGSCLIPDFFPALGYRKVSGVDYHQAFEILAISENLNAISSAEIQLLRIIQK